MGFKARIYSNIKVSSEENKMRILETKPLIENVKGENHHELQFSSLPEIFSDSLGRYVDPYQK